MKRIPHVDLRLDRFDSSGVTIHHPDAGNTLLRTAGPATLEQDGVIGRHPATGMQLILVATGSVEASGADGTSERLEPGDAVLIESGEQHETRALLPSVVAIMEWAPADD